MSGYMELLTNTFEKMYNQLVVFIGISRIKIMNARMKLNKG